MHRLLKIIVSLLYISTISMASEVLAMVNGHTITTEVKPKEFKTIDKALQEKILQRLTEKRVVSDYALSTPITESEEFRKILKQVLQINNDFKDKKSKEEFLTNIRILYQNSNR